MDAPISQLLTVQTTPLYFAGRSAESGAVSGPDTVISNPQYEYAIPTVQRVLIVRIVTADFNNDGAPDLIAQNWGNGSVTLLINQSQWTNPQQPGLFNLSGTYSVGSPGRNSIGYLAADFNGDGIPDLVVSNETDGTIGILPGAMVGSSTVMNVSVTGGSGSHQIQASFSPNGGSNYTSSVSNILSVASMIMSQLTLYPSPTYTYGISGSVSACIMQPIGAPVPTGTFTYSIDTIPQGSPVPLMPGCTQLPLGTTLFDRRPHHQCRL